MFDLLQLIFGKKPFSMEIIPPGSVYAKTSKENRLVIVIDLDQKPKGSN